MNKRKAAFLLATLLFLTAAGLALIDPLEAVDWRISDLFFRPRPVSSDITIIAIDDKSLNPEAGLGRFRDWPRSYYAQALRAINTFKPAVVAFDLEFTAPSRGVSELRVKQLLREYERVGSSGGGGGFNWYELLKRFETPSPSGGAQVEITHPDDLDFQKALSESGPVVLNSRIIFSERPETSDSDIGSLSKGEIAPIFSGENIVAAFADVFLDRDGVLRRFIPSVNGRESFTQAIVKEWNTITRNGHRDVAPVETKQRRIYYYGAPFSYRMISFVDVLSGKIDPASVAGKIVIFGATSKVIQDLYSTPTSADEMSGPEINANIVQQLIEGRRMNEQGRLSLILLLAILTIAGTLTFIRLDLKPLLAFFASIALGYPMVAYGFYQRGFALSVVYPEIAWTLTAIATLWYRSRTEFKEKGEIKRAFSHYVSPIVVSELAKHPETLRLGGTRREISVLFSDIVGFTTFSEKLSPEDTVAVLNDYLSAMTEVVFTYHGTLDKYQGDAIMALFGAPLDDVHHAVNAGSAALGMRKALSALHEKWGSIPQLPFKEELTALDFRVGIATGPAVIGNVGSRKRFDYTAIGDIVNLGSRLESINRKYGTRVIVDKGTFIAITNNHNPFVFRKLDTVRVKGKRQETEIFELFGLAETQTNDAKQMLDDFENGRILYTQRNFNDAKQYFEAALSRAKDDNPSQIYLGRCNYYIRKPPAREWDAVVELHEK